MPKVVADETIYQAVIETIMEKGYVGATTRHIADAAGVSEVTLFRKYGNKAQLTIAAIEATVQEDEFQTAVVYTGDIQADLLQVVQMYQGTSQKNSRLYYTMMLEIPRQPELADLLHIPMGMMQKVAQLLQRYMSEGILHPEPPLQVVAALIGPLIATNMIHTARQDIPLPPLDLSLHVVRFLNGRVKNN